MKLSVVKGSVWGLTFLIALTVFGILTNRGNMDTTADMENATLPLEMTSALLATRKG